MAVGKQTDMEEHMEQAASARQQPPQRRPPLAQEQIRAQTRFLGPPQDRGPGAASRPDGAEKIRQPALKEQDSGPTHPPTCGSDPGLFTSA
jgi:hypothetical protein